MIMGIVGLIFMLSMFFALHMIFFSQDKGSIVVFILMIKDKKVAKAHFNKCKKNPYSIGEVRIMTDKTFHTVMSVKDLED